MKYVAKIIDIKNSKNFCLIDDFIDFEIDYAFCEKDEIERYGDLGGVYETENYDDDGLKQYYSTAEGVQYWTECQEMRDKIVEIVSEIGEFPVKVVEKEEEKNMDYMDLHSKLEYKIIRHCISYIKPPLLLNKTGGG